MRTKYLIIPLLLAIMISVVFITISCHKSTNQISIKGLVVDPNSKINVEGATVVLSANILQDGVYSAGYDELSRTVTDASGGFTFSFKEERIGGYRIYITKDEYFSYMIDISANDIKANETYSPVYHLYPIGYIKLKVNNVNPFDSLDQISYTFSSGYMNCYECCDNSMRYGNGMVVNDLLKCKTAGNQDVKITWIVNKNNGLTQHEGTVFCKAFDTVSFQINY